MDTLRPGIPEACYFGCPDIDFRGLEASVRAAQADVARAQGCGLSETAVTILQAHANTVQARVEDLAFPHPKDADGPWRPGLTSEQKVMAGGAASALLCCRVVRERLFVKRPRNHGPGSLAEVVVIENPGHTA